VCSNEPAAIFYVFGVKFIDENHVLSIISAISSLEASTGDHETNVARSLIEVFSQLFHCIPIILGLLWYSDLKRNSYERHDSTTRHTYE